MRKARPGHIPAGLQRMASHARAEYTGAIFRVARGLRHGYGEHKAAEHKSYKSRADPSHRYLPVQVTSLVALRRSPTKLSLGSRCAGVRDRKSTRLNSSH